jgi:hypothetical protein
VQVSTDGGVEAWWSRTGDELFYFSLSGALMSMPVKSLTAATRPVVVFPPRSFVYQPNGTASATFDVAPDGRLLMIRQAGQDQQAAPQMVVVQNWFETLRRTFGTLGTSEVCYSPIDRRWVRSANSCFASGI